MNIEIQNIKITTLRNAIRQQFERYFLYSFSNIRNETISTYYQEKKKKRKIHARNIRNIFIHKLDAHAHIVHGPLIEARARTEGEGRYYKIIGIRECYRCLGPQSGGT